MKLPILLLSCLIITPTFAVESPHIVELRGALGGVDASIEEGSTTEELNDISTGEGSFGYHYRFHDNFSLGIEKTYGDTESFVEISDAFTDSELEYDITSLVLTADISLTKRNKLYLRLLASSYDYDVFDDGEVVGSSDGSEFSYGFGWSYRWDSGFGLSLGVDSRSLGQDVEIDTISYGVSYQF